MAPTRKAPPLETTLVELEKPYSGRISSFGWHRDAVISDGKMMSNWSEDISHQIYYNSVPLRKEWEKFFALGDWWWLPVQAFYGGGMKPLRSFLDLADIHTAGTSVVDGVRCQVVESADPEETRTTTYTVDGPDGYAVTEHAPNPYWHARTLLYFGPDHLLRKSVKIGSGASYSLTLSDIRTNVRLNPSDFKFQPPAGAKPFPITPMHTSLIDGPAPDFILPDSTGGSVSLHGSLKGKKLMLLTMIDHLDLRRRELLALEKTYQTLKADGFTALVVDIDDTADAIKKSLAQAPISYPVLTPRSSAAAKALLASYRAHVFPTSFLVNGRGTIVWSDSTYVTPGTFYIKMQLDHPERWDHSTQRKR